MSTNFDSIFINGTSLRPAPSVSTAYEYNKSGDYTIGGLLIVTLSGTLIGEDINAQITALNSLQLNSDCVSLTIGCSGGTDFLNGNGRIRTITFSPSEQPFVSTYSMIVAIETVDGKPAVEVDQDFLKDNCLSEDGGTVQFIQNYNEKLTFQGEANTISSYDSTLDVLRSFVKIGGEINVSSYGRPVCGSPSYNGTQNSLDLLKKRAKSLVSLTTCNNTILSKYNGWNKWLDTKRLTINIDGSITWVFEMYLTKGSKAPQAWIEISTENAADQRKKMENIVMNGKIQGLSSASLDDHLSHKVNINERLQNAIKGYNSLLSIVENGNWGSENIVLVDDNKDKKKKNPEKFCRQRISSSTVASVVTGEISFRAEFGDISTCSSTQGVGSTDVTIDEQLPASRYAEFIIPNGGRALVQQITPSTPTRVIITARGNLNGCNTNNMITLTKCAENQMTTALKQLPYFRKLILLSDIKNIGKYSYTIKREYIACDTGTIRARCTTNTQPKYTTTPK